MMLQRASDLATSGKKLFATPALEYFLYADAESFGDENRQTFLKYFSELDDNDIISAAKVWSKDDDPVLRYLCLGFVNRRLFRIEISGHPFKQERIEKEKSRVSEHLGISRALTKYLVISESISNHAYSNLDDNIKILDKKGNVRDISERSEILNVHVLSGNLKKFYLCYPKIL